MATSLASQLQALKSAVKADTESLKRPITRPSILFNPKDAADIDIDTIFSLALSGLDTLIHLEERFRNYKNDLFSHTSRELDRELMTIDENNKINTSISSYLRLLSGYFESLAARRTLEYLIRRYKIYVYNVEELVLCALPYHDTHEFVRVVQLIDTGNSRWKFLDGVKASGAPPPRKVIVQQCLKDLGVLEVICNYATPTRKIQPLRPVTSFCTAVVIEVLGYLTTVDSDIVKRLLPYVVSGLQPGTQGILEQKAGALMIVGLLAQKVSLSPSLVKSLVRSVAEVAREDANMSNDLQWVRMSFMALINLVQLQHLEVIPKKIVDILTEIRDFSQLLCGLIMEFNIHTFVSVLLDSLLEYSSSDKKFHQTLMEIIETVPLKDSVTSLVSKLLKTCLRVSRSKDQSVVTESGGQAKQILFTLYKKYPDEVREAVREILQDTKLQSSKEGSNHELLCRVLDGNLEFSPGIPDSKIWFALEHPKVLFVPATCIHFLQLTDVLLYPVCFGLVHGIPFKIYVSFYLLGFILIYVAWISIHPNDVAQAEVRRSALTGLNMAVILSDNALDSKGVDIIRDVIVRRLEDDDLSVVGAVLTVERLNEMIDPRILLETLQKVLKRCIQILIEGSSNNKSLASDVAVACLQLAVMSFKDQDEYTRALATMIFPLVLILPKSQRINFKALELSKEVKWPFYGSLINISRPEKVWIPNSDVKTLQKLQGEHTSSVNLENISKLAEYFLMHHEELMPWLVECCNASEASKTLFFLLLLKSFMMPVIARLKWVNEMKDMGSLVLVGFEYYVIVLMFSGGEILL
ncbi:hypothetical protein M9H77_10653 [Catharanthus roseus]|uniref:Uncharacterized protein n=1 Tax=Catharanthus roseus TaxID=4058 RepID=A0ACC0BCC1_CATRO|nr:hypothetical protein M9H77_10653 [Catharanthus roseus]